MTGFVGEAVLSGFIQKLVDMVTSPDLWKYARKEQVDSELKKWKNILIKIHAVLHDAEEKQITNPLVKMWLDELRDLAYDVEDVLDDFATEALRSSLIMAQPQQGTSKVRGVFSSLIPSASMSNFSMGSKIEEITARLQDISDQKNALDLREIAAGCSDRKRKRAQILPTTSLVIESRVYGRETDQAAIVDMLLKDDPSSDDEISVIPIVGMGGIGKTTLAQLAFNDDKVKAHFELRAWVCVSDDFDVLRITKTILLSVDPGTRDVNDLNLLQISLKEKLSGKKFLLVLDDVWNEKCEEWEILCKPMTAGAPGSKLIVTTRNEGVVTVTGTCQAYPIRELSYNDCLSLFTQQALRTRNFDAHPHLKEVGEEIVRRCKGLPLAAKALGGKLRNQLSRDEWANILTSKIWDFPKDKSQILPALMLSYHHLPSHLKRCFAYCSLFPKDYEFDKDNLILLWMAEGFLQQTKKEIRPEDLGSKYFDDLFSRSLFQHSSQDSSQFVMHDHINNLAQFVAEGICFHLDSAWNNNKQSTISEKARHSTFDCRNYELLRKFEPFLKVKCLRTLVALHMNHFFLYSISSKVLDDLFKELKCLRVLSLSGLRIDELPDSIGNLKYLRYLNLSYTWIGRLPGSVGHLYNLQALILSDCDELTMLPIEIGNLINLRHLYISNTEELQEMPSQIGNLINLQTLSKFIVGQGSSSRLRELKNLFNLRKLSILGLHNVMDIQDARDANLESKHLLEELEVGWSNSSEELEVDWSNGSYDSQNEMHDRHVLEQLRPQRNLKELRIKSYHGSRFPSWMKDPSFPMMTHLILGYCRRCISLPALGQLSSLKVLHIIGMRRVRRIGAEFYGGTVKPFPSLESLKFVDMPKWEYWFGPEQVVEGELFPRLRELTIKTCLKIDMQFPICLPSAVKFNLFDCPNLGFPFSRFLDEESSKECNEMVLRSEVDSGLQTLAIRRCDWLVSLEEQRLPCNLKNLKIYQCANLEKLPNELRTLMCLEKLKIRGCPKLESFPVTGLPPMLRRLVVIDCKSLKWLPHNYYSSALESLEIRYCPSLTSFPNGELPTTLKELFIGYCEKIESLPKEMMNHNSACCLEIVGIHGCQSLKSFPTGELPSTLKRFEILNCSNLESMSENMCPNNSALEFLHVRDYPNLRTLPECLLHSLKELYIEDCEGLECFPARGLSTPNLTKLCISQCQNLKSLPLRNLKSLQELMIFDCPGVESFSEGGLAPNLTSLEVDSCENIKTPISEWGLQSLTSLSELTIQDMFPDMVSFSDEECLLPISLTSLAIHGMKYLASLALQNLISLQYLNLLNCPNLQSLGLMPAKLEKLEILDCPMLEVRYSKEKGEYWPDIAHIPCIKIDGEDMH